MTKSFEARYVETNRLLNKLEKITDTATAARVKKIKNRLRLPIQVILERIDGKTMAAKARTIGVSRQTVHCWINGIMRPNETQATRIAGLTGFTVAEIRGKS